MQWDECLNEGTNSRSSSKNLMRQMELRAFTSSSIANQMPLIIRISSPFVLSISVAVRCMSYEVVPFAPNPMVKINEVGGKIASYQAVRSNIFLSTWSNVFWPMRFNFLPFSLFTPFRCVYAARQLFDFLFVCECVCVCVFYIQCNAATTIYLYGCAHEDVHSSQFTNGKTCCCRLLHDGRSLLHVWFFFGICMRVIEQTADRPSERVALYARILHLSYPKNAFVRRQQQKNKCWR